ncbi:hypothetical protein [Leucobacter coleopterorum]|uniref:hypothetical protein n=1 Tax=Leucobacter coleopterorum TaxID=2714933 RepID=UPI001FCBCAE7|nr:hypothetical protein [Leucobacter coleopterorum]
MSSQTTQISLLNRVRVAPGKPRDWSVIASAVFLLLVVITAAISPFLTEAATSQSILDSLLPRDRLAIPSAPTSSAATCCSSRSRARDLRLLAPS